MANKIRGKKEGSIFKRKNGSWRAQVSIEGKRISYSAKTKKECQIWIHKISNNLDQGWDYANGQTVLKDYLEQWLNAHEITLRDYTSHRYKQVIRLHINPNIGDIQLNDLTINRIERFYRALIKGGIGIRTTREAHAILHKALNKAVRYGFIQNNPAHGAALPRYRHTEMQVLDEKEVNRFLAASSHSFQKALYQVALTTGMRQGELFGLQWPDINWDNEFINVKRQVQRIPQQGWKFVQPKTKAGKRSITLGDNSLQVLKRQLETQKNQRAKIGERWQENNLIFPSSIGTPLNPSNLRIDFKRILSRADLPDIRFHDLRHTAASLMLTHGVPVIVVSKILGHAKPSTTMDIYGHMINEMQGEAVRIMNDLVPIVQVTPAQQ